MYKFMLMSTLVVAGVGILTLFVTMVRDIIYNIKHKKDEL